MPEKNEPSPPCIICGEPGPMTRMFSELKANLCAEHYSQSLHPSTQFTEKG